MSGKPLFHAVTLAVCAAPLVAHAATADDTAGRARVAGFAALGRGDLDTAAAAFGRALARNHSDGDALGGLGVVRLRQNRYADASKLLAGASRYGKPASWAEPLAAARFFEGLGSAQDLLAQGRIDQAETAALGLVELGFAHPGPAYEILGAVAAWRDQAGTAAAFYQRASEGAGTDTPRLLVLSARAAARAAQARGDVVGAERVLREAVALAGDDAWSRHDLAHLLIRVGKPAQAEPQLAALAGSGRADHIYAAALVAGDLGRPEQAARLLAQIPPAARTTEMQDFARRNEINLKLASARALVARGQLKQAWVLLNETRGFAPGNAQVVAAIASVDQAQGRSLAALRLMREAHRLLSVGAKPPTPMGNDPDPLLAQLGGSIERLSESTAPRIDAQLAWHDSTGEAGLGRLSTVTSLVKVSAAAASVGRVWFSGSFVRLDSGHPGASGLARIGRNPTEAALALAAGRAAILRVPVPFPLAGTRRDGTAVAIGWNSDKAAAEIGLSAIGIGPARATWRISASPGLAPHLTASAWFERKALTQSLVAYAGLRDPVSGVVWGKVMRTGGGVGLGWDRDGSGVYADVRYDRYQGVRLRANGATGANLGAYTGLLHRGAARLLLGVNFNTQSFARNENAFSFGNGGYFSPQRFFSVGVPLRLNVETTRLELKASVSPGYQSYRQDAAAVYPTDAAAQAQLDALHGANPSVLANYAGVRSAGAAVSAQLSAWCKVRQVGRFGVESSFDNFGNYNEVRVMFGFQQKL